jgi:hypothetical protein
MGYRSEVAVAIKPEYYPALINGVPERKELINDLISGADIHSHENGILLHWDHVKWYYNGWCEGKASRRAVIKVNK